MKNTFILLLIISFIFYACGNDTEIEKDTTTTSPVTEKLLYQNHSDSATYVGINTCKLCHQNIYSSFIKTGMGMSFDSASAQKSSGNFAHPTLYDKSSNFYYKAYFENGKLNFLEYRLEGKDTVFTRNEIADFIIGSGQHTNSHIQNVNGYLNQMPMTFYTQKGEWHLPPGFEDGHNTRFTRKIGLECLSCHNAYPELVMGSDNKYSKVPNGIDCERCHGPGSKHVEERRTGSKIDTSKFIDYTIVNPAKLSIDLQFDVCQRCHLQGNAILKQGKSFYDFKPGMKLSDFITVFLPKYEGADDEFIMASHADRLKMSQCFIKSFDPEKSKGKLKPYKDALTCITCHNPHVSVKETGNEIFNTACKNCHGNDKQKDCSREEAQRKNYKREADNCVKCHMPKSGSIDIPHVTVHDHYIRKPITAKDKQKIKQFLGLFAINEKNPSKHVRALAYINQYEKFDWNTSYLDSAQVLLDEKDLTQNFEALVQLYFLRQNYTKIISLTESFGKTELLKTRFTKKSYDNYSAWTCYRIGEAYSALNTIASANPFYKRSVELAPFVPDFSDKLGLSFAQMGDYANASKYFEITLKENPKHVSALINYGFLELTKGNSEKANQLYSIALQIDPDNEQLLMNLAGLKNYKKDFEGAKKLLKQILKRNPKNTKAKAILEQMERQKVS